jgi:formate dehydrogenase subunit gamma
MTATRGSGTRTASAEGGYVRRFSGAERALHWIHALSFFGLLATGLVLYLPSLAGTFGSREDVKTIHLCIGSTPTICAG